MPATSGNAPKGSPLPPSLSAPWGRHDIPPDSTLPLRLGPRDLWFRAQSGEVWIAHGDAPQPKTRRSEAPLAPEPPQDVEWSRWATPGGEREVELRPALPDRAVVLKPERSFRLLPRAEARVYVRVPLWLRIELPTAEGSDALLLESIPSLAMSDTWWGSFTEGELTYWLPTTARREMRPELHVPHVAVCALQMLNRSGSELEVENLAFRVAHLSLFVDGNGHFWGDETRVTYQGEAEGSQINMSGKPPPDAGDARLVASPRSPVQKGFRARTFQRLMTLPGLGGGA
jgi:hypothetical protein